MSQGRSTCSTRVSSSVLAVTNVRFVSPYRLMVGPVSLTTKPVPFRKTQARHERYPRDAE